MSSNPVKVVTEADGRAIYTTHDGDVLDHICWRHYGTEHRTTEAVIEANAGAVIAGAVLPAGLRVVLPVIEIETTPATQIIQLFD